LFLFKNRAVRVCRQKKNYFLSPTKHSQARQRIPRHFWGGVAGAGCYLDNELKITTIAAASAAFKTMSLLSALNAN
jgi:hypothetical protein